MIIGYTAGVFDMFHTGHLNLLKNAKGMCDKLVVGVSTDELAAYKGRKPIIPFCERIEIVKSICYVDVVVPQEDMDKRKMCDKLGAEIMFVGDDWYGSDKWMFYESEFASVGKKIIYLPYTKGISTTDIRKRIKADET